MRAKDSDGLSRLDQQCFVVLERLQLAHDRVETRPVAGSLARTAVDDEIVRSFRYVGVQVIHQASKRRFLMPSFAIQLCASWRVNHSVVHQGLFRTPKIAKPLRNICFR